MILQAVTGAFTSIICVATAQGRFFGVKRTKSGKPHCDVRGIISIKVRLNTCCKSSAGMHQDASAIDRIVQRRPGYKGVGNGLPWCVAIQYLPPANSRHRGSGRKSTGSNAGWRRLTKSFLSKSAGPLLKRVKKSCRVIAEDGVPSTAGQTRLVNQGVFHIDTWPSASTQNGHAPTTLHRADPIAAAVSDRGETLWGPKEGCFTSSPPLQEFAQAGASASQLELDEDWRQ